MQIEAITNKRGGIIGYRDRISGTPFYGRFGPFKLRAEQLAIEYSEMIAARQGLTGNVSTETRARLYEQSGLGALEPGEQMLWIATEQPLWMRAYIKGKIAGVVRYVAQQAGKVGRRLKRRPQPVQTAFHFSYPVQQGEQYLCVLSGKLYPNYSDAVLATADILKEQDAANVKPGTAPHVRRQIFDLRNGWPKAVDEMTDANGDTVHVGDSIEIDKSIWSTHPRRILRITADINDTRTAYVPGKRNAEARPLISEQFVKYDPNVPGITDADRRARDRAARLPQKKGASDEQACTH